MGGLLNGSIPDVPNPLNPKPEVEKSSFEIAAKRLEIDVVQNRPLVCIEVE